MTPSCACWDAALIGWLRSWPILAELWRRENPHDEDEHGQLAVWRCAGDGMEPEPDASRSSSRRIGAREIDLRSQDRPASCFLS